MNFPEFLMNYFRHLKVKTPKDFISFLCIFEGKTGCETLKQKTKINQNPTDEIAKPKGKADSQKRTSTISTTK